ncbi:hypothetical protein [Ruania albidiflava]|uniref:hypothetical protein n=1 Tax=Ruania albidiflava TaxID=366586 RepID=UPI0023F42CDF|nr:hypothetical protein [Ruania albidiflava]
MGIRSLLDARIMVMGPLAAAHGLAPTMADFVRAFARGFAVSGGQVVQTVPDERLVQFLGGSHPSSMGSAPPA